METGKYLGKCCDGEDLHVGDFVGWKDDLEQSGTIVGKKGYCYLIEKWDSNTCEEETVYIEKERVWKE